MAQIISRRYGSEDDELPGHICSYCGEKIDQEEAIYRYSQGCEMWACKDCEDDFWQDIRGDYLRDNREE